MRLLKENETGKRKATDDLYEDQGCKKSLGAKLDDDEGVEGDDKQENVGEEFDGHVMQLSEN
jgi:hypothetical protein